MNQGTPLITTKLWLEGEELDPEVFSEIVGRQPTGSGKRGELVENPNSRKLGRKVPATFWRLSIERRSESTDEGIQEILACIWARREEIIAYLRANPGVKAGITTVVQIHEDRPVYEISRDSIQKLAVLKLEYGMDDIYHVTGEREAQADE